MGFGCSTVEMVDGEAVPVGPTEIEALTAIAREKAPPEKIADSHAWQRSPRSLQTGCYSRGARKPRNFGANFSKDLQLSS